MTCLIILNNTNVQCTPPYPFFCFVFKAVCAQRIELNYCKMVDSDWPIPIFAVNQWRDYLQILLWDSFHQENISYQWTGQIRIGQLRKYETSCPCYWDFLLFLHFLTDRQTQLKHEDTLKPQHEKNSLQDYDHVWSLTNQLN